MWTGPSVDVPGRRPPAAARRTLAARFTSAVRLTFAALTIMGVAAAPLAAQGDSDGLQERSDEADGRRWWNVWSEPSPEDRMLWGMWTTHLNRDDDGWQNDRILALIYEGFYAATFRTTHGPIAYTVGVERSWVEGSAGPLFGMVGFRSGLVYGYDGRLGWVADKYPVLPFAQPVLYGRLGPLTTDLTYTWVVISLTAGLRF